MTSQRLDLGPEPYLRIEPCAGDLQIRGMDRVETRIEGSGLEIAHVEIHDNGAVIDKMPGSGVISMPAGGSVTIRGVGGDLDIRDVKGPVHVEGDVEGNCTVHGVGGLSISGVIGGTLQLKEIEGPVGCSGEVGGNCVARLINSLVISGPVGGTLQVRKASGLIQVDRIQGDCSARQITEMATGSIGGGASVRTAEGAVTFGPVGGDVVLRDVGGPVALERVGGDLLGRNVPAGFVVGGISGDLSLHTNFRPATVSRFDAVGGDASIHVPPRTSVRFVVPAGTSLHLPRELEAVSEGEQAIVTLGDGLATVHLTVDGSVIIKERGDDDLGDEFAAAFDEDFAASWESITARVEEQLGARLQDLPDHVRSHVEANLDASRRHMEAAQRKAEQAVRRAERHALESLGAAQVSIGSSSPDIAPISEEERLAVLQMLEEGKISVEEAEELLAALEGRE